jgi:hypothetical protein
MPASETFVIAGGGLAGAKAAEAPPLAKCSKTEGMEAQDGY